MNILRCQGLGCDIRSYCDRYEPQGLANGKNFKSYFLAKRLNKFFEACLFFKGFK
tara:strand:+ start:567 stop:731 length:165 start_codon:yes stop_codon:yes gene_type:complete